MLENILNMINFKDKTVAVLGWGIDTQDIVPFLSKNGAHVTIYDKKDVDTKGVHIEKVKWVLGKDHFGDLSRYDTVVRSPGVYRYRPEIVAAEKRGVKITSKMKMFFDLCPAPIIGITGTKGKGTTATLIYRILAATDEDIYLGGNIGTGVFDFLPKLTSRSWVVLELSSFQLIDLHRSPHIAVVLMTTQEHQDWHPTVDEYIVAKRNIVAFQTKKDVAVVAADYPNSLKLVEGTLSFTYQYSTLRRRVPGCYLENETIVFENGPKEPIIKVSDVKLRGRHNLENIMAAIIVSKVVGVENDVISRAIANFKGLEHRLEEVGEVGGVKYYNDSFSTTPETTIAAIKSFSEPLILIVGGSEKGSDFCQLGEEISRAKNIKAVLLIGLMADRIQVAIDACIRGGLIQAGGRPRIIRGLKTMRAVVKKAAELSSPGDVVLLSPGAASFDMFENYKDRGQQFKKAVERLEVSG